MTDLQIVDEIKANKWEYTEYCFLCLSKYYTKFACMMTHSRKIFISISAYSAKSRSENVPIRNILYESCIPTFVGIHPAFLDKKIILPIPTSCKVGSNVKCPLIEKIEKSSQLSQTTLSLEGFFLWVWLKLAPPSIVYKSVFIQLCEATFVQKVLNSSYMVHIHAFLYVYLVILV